jgi:CHAT domain-containing protein
VGDPSYSSDLQPGATVQRYGLDLTSFERVRNTRSEVLGVARTLLVRERDLLDTYASRLVEMMGERSSTLRTPLFDLFLGEEASSSNLRENAANRSVIHIAAHGYIDAKDPLQTGLVLSFDAETGGLVTLRDVLDLELDAELTVLSACDTARGEVLRGEGVQSLAYAFLQAGSRSVIASLWNVIDLDASGLMESFYRGYLDRSEPAPLALRKAKLDLRRAKLFRGRPVGEAVSGGRIDSSHPYFWAPFIYMGARP